MQLNGDIDFRGQCFGIARHQEDIIKGQGFLGKTLIDMGGDVGGDVGFALNAVGAKFRFCGCLY